MSGNYTPVSCLVDSGATHTFIAADAVARLGLQPVPAEQLEVTLDDESVFVCSEKVDMPVVFGAMGTFGEQYPCTKTCLVAGRLHQDVILGMDWLQREDLSFHGGISRSRFLGRASRALSLGWGSPACL